MKTSSVALRSFDGRSALEWANPRLTRRNRFTCTAVLDHDGETSGVELEMITPYREVWIEYADELASSVDGWDGVKSWSSEYAQLALDCSNDGSGIVRVRVRIGRLDRDDLREAAFDLRVSDLPRFRDELRRFLRYGS